MLFPCSAAQRRVPRRAQDMAELYVADARERGLPAQRHRCTHPVDPPRGRVLTVPYPSAQLALPIWLMHTDAHSHRASFVLVHAQRYTCCVPMINSKLTCSNLETDMARLLQQVPARRLAFVEGPPPKKNRKGVVVMQPYVAELQLRLDQVPTHQLGDRRQFCGQSLAVCLLQVAAWLLQSCGTTA